ncbi:MAG: hypothetical protein AAFN77_19580 [Planctomycetota bacterium]
MYPAAWSLTYRDVQTLCRLAYKGNVNNIKVSCYVSVENHRWQVLKVEADDRTGFRAILATGLDTGGNRVRVLSFAGSSDPMVSFTDWGVKGNAGNFLKGASRTAQYKQALSFAQGNPADYFVGHSLGGGLALYCCINQNVRTATINPSPIFDEYFGTDYGDKRDTDIAINYCTPRDMLRHGRGLAKNGANVNMPITGAKLRLTTSLGATPGQEVQVGSVGKSEVDQHVMDFLVGFAEPKFALVD